MFSYLTQPPFRFTQGKGDPYVTRLSEWVEQSYQPGEAYDFAIIGVPLSKSSISFSGAHAHPLQFRQLLSSFTTYNFDEDVELASLRAVDLGDVAMHVTDIACCQQNIESALQEVTSNVSALPIIVGGDHSITYRAITGIKRAKPQRIGLIQFDAHLDVRDTNYGGTSNGTPMRSLMESEVIRGEDIVTIGLRSFANSREYRQYAEGKGMTLITANQVRQRGIEAVVIEALRYLEAKCDAIYITFDVDVMDQSTVPGVPAIGPAGLSSVDLLFAAHTVGKSSKVIAMDMVCVDPTKDVRDMTSRVALHLFLHFATGYHQRK
ncbi:agmatinase family protein [Brevibacillus centrosporus]|jgi:formiminoglutamase|uniref:agmatinase family protein n=1 Tax=Brevibacillus centrosporus TaxID=54910 RepID=UPI003986457E